MKIESIQLGESLNIKKFLDKFKLKSAAKDPVVLAWKNNSHVVLFRYGVVVLWNFKDGDKNDFLAKIEPFISKPLSIYLSEEAEWKASKHMDVLDGVVKSKALDLPQIQLISVSLARTVIMDFFEKEVDELLIRFSEIIDKFTGAGHAKISSKSLLRLAGSAMAINNRAVSQMAMLDKPDFTWDDPELDALFGELEEEYEISDRYSILNKKIETLFHDSEFIMNLLESRKGNFLELVIIALFVADILLLLWEQFV